MIPSSWKAPCGWPWCDGGYGLDSCGECASARTPLHHAILLAIALWWIVLLLGVRLWLLLRRAQ